MSANPISEYTSFDGVIPGELRLTGQVFDETKEGVPGATVTVSSTAALSPATRRFTLRAYLTDVIAISSLPKRRRSKRPKKNIVVELVQN